MRKPDAGRPEIRRARMKNYGLSQEAFEALLERQGSACAICKESFSRMPARYLHVDHDHRTGVVRGLLCHFCNVGLGKFQDDASVIEKAIAYLERTRT